MFKLIRSLKASLIATILLSNFALAESEGIFIKAQKDQATFYLFGSIHLGTSDMYPLSDQVEQAFLKSGSLFLEVNLSGSETDIANILNEKSMLPKGQSLKSLLSSKVYAQAEQAAKELNMPIELFQFRKPWYFSMMLSQMKMLSMGFAPQLGIDMYFEGKAKSRNIPTHGFETIAEQLELLEAAMDINPDHLVTQSIDELTVLEQKLGQLIGAWKKGDDQKVADFMNSELESYPQIKEILLDRRNQNWAKQINTLNPKKPVFIVVGAGHLAGKNSLPDYLDKAGYDIIRY